MSLIPRHIVEREDRKTLDLLRFALSQHGVTATLAAPNRLEVLDGMDEGFLLYEEGTAWQVRYLERGSERDEATFPNSFNAVNFLYCRLIPSPSPFDFREEWKVATGQMFSLVD